jgi:hypothetical protein
MRDIACIEPHQTETLKERTGGGGGQDCYQIMTRHYITRKLTGTDDFVQVGVSENKVNEMRRHMLLIALRYSFQAALRYGPWR